MKKTLKNIWIIIYVVCFLIRHKGWFEIWMDGKEYNKKYFIDYQKDGDCYLYPNIWDVIKDIYEY